MLGPPSRPTWIWWLEACFAGGGRTFLSPQLNGNFGSGRTPIPTAVQGLKEPKAKAVPDMVSVLSTAA